MKASCCSLTAHACSMAARIHVIKLSAIGDRRVAAKPMTMMGPKCTAHLRFPSPAQSQRRLAGLAAALRRPQDPHADLRDMETAIHVEAATAFDGMRWLQTTSVNCIIHARLCWSRKPPVLGCADCKDIMRQLAAAPLCCVHSWLALQAAEMRRHDLRRFITLNCTRMLFECFSPRLWPLRRVSEQWDATFFEQLQLRYDTATA